MTGNKLENEIYNLYKKHKSPVVLALGDEFIKSSEFIALLKLNYIYTSIGTAFTLTMSITSICRSLILLQGRI